MKQTILQITAVFFLLTGFKAKAQESEPNDNFTQANILALNGSNSGAMNVAGDIDWWSVTTTGDGQLNITINISNSKKMVCQIYDNNGNIKLEEGVTSNTKTISKDGLAAGTYYLKCFAYSIGQLPQYTISNTLDEPAMANDIEPNNSRQQATVLGLNQSNTGHINYYYHNDYDKIDWYKVTTLEDGMLRLKMESGNGQNAWIYLYDNDGITLLSAGDIALSSFTIDNDGLAAGTYYIKVKMYENGGWAPYTITDSFYSANNKANDPEPNNQKSQALNLPLNSSADGHIGFYYNLQKDTSDWYKITTNADGKLQIKMESGYGQNVLVYLFDNDGTTMLDVGYTSGTSNVINKDGLAPGTYYIRVNAYDSYDGWATYTITDSLITNGTGNDPEPNDTKEQALIFAPNSTMAGHINYYYNLQRDKFDWYQITLPKDGNLNISFSSLYGQNIWVYLFDNDGVTVLDSVYTYGYASFDRDGLQAGTYFLRISIYYGTGWATYSLINAFTPYNNENDVKANGAAFQAETLDANGTITGHVNFYYNKKRDNADWYKINYTGSGPLTLNFTQDAHISNGVFDTLSVSVYNDTLTNPLFQQKNASENWQMNMNGLIQGYYYLKLNTINPEDFVSYSLNNDFQQITKVKITLMRDSITNNCNTGAIMYRCSQVSGPYTVTLYRYGVPFNGGKLRLLNNKTQFLFMNLPPGLYYASGYGDGATGNAFGTSQPDTLMPVPDQLNTTGIGAITATLRWKSLQCLKYYKIRYRKVGDGTWTKITTTDNSGSNSLSGLDPNTVYEWQVASVDTSSSYIITSAYSSIEQFTTNTTFTNNFNNGISNKSRNENVQGDVETYPNPANDQFKIQINRTVTGAADVILKSIDGKIVWSAFNKDASKLNGTTVKTGNLPNGFYMLQVILPDGKIYNSKVVISR